MAQATPPPSARKHYVFSALLAARAAREALKVRTRGLGAVVNVIRTNQAAQALQSQRAVRQMLSEQNITTQPDANLRPTAFTSTPEALSRMIDATSMEAEFNRLVESIVQDAGRAAESVATATYPDIYHVRYVTPPCCGRCAVLAGRAYRWSEGFLRHPNCDCVMVPTTVAAPFAQSPDRLFDAGQITGLSKADMKAIHDGADVARVVNVRRKGAGLSESGRVLARAGRPTPEGIYRLASDRVEAIELLTRFNYVS